MQYSIDGGKNWNNIAAESVDISGVNENNDIKIKKLATDPNTRADSLPQTIDITRPAAPSLTSVQPSTIGGKGSIPTEGIHQISTNGTDWEDCLAAKDGLDPATYYVRIKANGNALSSRNQEITIIAFVPAKEATPSAIFTANGSSSGTLSGITAGMKYRIDSSGWMDITDSEDIELTGLAECTISLIKPGNETTTIDSDEQIISITKALGPAAIDSNDCTSSAQNDGVISGVDASMEYQKQGDESWTDVAGEEITGLTPGTYNVRVKANEAVLASDSLSIDIKEYVRRKPKRPNGGSFGESINTGNVGTGDDSTGNVSIEAEQTGGDYTGVSTIISRFEDIDTNAYYAKAAAWAIENGITAGTSASSFSPEAPCTRSQIVTFLWAAMGKPEVHNSRFEDVDANAYYAKAVAWAVEAGITSGTSANAFSPDAVCTRAQAVSLLRNALKDGNGGDSRAAISGNGDSSSAAISSADKSSLSTAASSRFGDVPSGSYYEQAVTWAVQQGITSGTSANTFSPDAPCTRAQIVAFLWSAMAK